MKCYTCEFLTKRERERGGGGRERERERQRETDRERERKETDHLINDAGQHGLSSISDPHGGGHEVLGPLVAWGVAGAVLQHHKLLGWYSTV